MNDATYVYVMGRREGPVKIGVSRHPQLRRSTLQTGCHFLLELLGAVQVPTRAKALSHESTVLGVWEKERLAGEWLDISSEQAFESVCTAIEIDEIWNDAKRGWGW